MKVISRDRALDKLYKRRDRYEVPDWQRSEVWDRARKQQLIDSILRGWRLPKFYFLKTAADPETYEVVDGQQRLAAIFEYFDNLLPLPPESVKMFGGPLYKDLRAPFSDAFDDFEIQFDEIEDVDEREIKEFFQRLQGGLPLTASERLNSVHTKLRDFARGLSKHRFFTEKVSASDKRYGHFDIAAKMAALEIDGLNTGLRYDDLEELYESQANFSSRSATARRLRETVEFLDRAFPARHPMLKNRTVVQSVGTLAARLIGTDAVGGYEKRFREFVERFMSDLTRQVELGKAATDVDYVRFQRSVNANVKSGAKTRHEILLRKLFTFDPSVLDMFDPAMIAESGVESRIKQLEEEVVGLVGRINSTYAAQHGTDLFKLTNKSSQALARLAGGRKVRSMEEYGGFVDDLYFLFHEGPGERLKPAPSSLVEVNDLRTELRHDVDHGTAAKVRSKRRKLASVFAKYAGTPTADTLSPDRFPLVQMNVLAAIALDLNKLLAQVVSQSPSKPLQPSSAVGA